MPFINLKSIQDLYGENLRIFLGDIREDQNK